VKAGLVKAMFAVVALSVMVAGCSSSDRASTQSDWPSVDSVASPGSGPFLVRVTCHDDPSDASRLQRAIDASSRGATIAIGGLCLLTRGITLLPDRSYIGSSPTGTVLRQAASMGFVLATDAYVRNFTYTGDPLTIRDLTVACNGSGQTDGIILVNWLVDVEHVIVRDCGGSGIVDSSVTANGRSITNTSVNSRFENNFITNSGRYGFYVKDPQNSVTDGYLQDNQIALSGADAIHLDNAAGWYISGNNLYGVGQNAIYANRLFGTTISNNYVEDFGSKQRSGTWYGIEATAQGGTGSTISGNKVFNTRGQSLEASYVYIGIILVNSGTSYLAASGNVIVGTGSGGIGFLFRSQANRLVVASSGNQVAGVSTGFDRSDNAVISQGG
jgi:parallel beta helix pectate lyase-like protein